jgi:hypothetical protein
MGGYSSRAPVEPVITDNLNGNWTASWTLDNPDNYTLTNIELTAGKAKLKFNDLNFFENSTLGFSNGTFKNTVVVGTSGVGLDLRRNAYYLIADKANHRVLEVDYDKWLWQYGTNSTTGVGLNQLNNPNYAVRLANNRILITDTGNNRVIEVGQNGEFYWQYGSNSTSGSGDNLLNAPMSAVPMGNGNILIADSGNDYVIEINRSKNIVWQYDTGLSVPEYAEELSNGSILISDRGNHRIIEVNRSKQKYWQHGTGIKGAGDDQLDNPSHATRLENGNTLISDTRNHRALEVNVNNNIVWQYGITKTAGFGVGKMSRPTCAIRLQIGNTVITDSFNDRVVQVTNAKEWFGQYGLNNTAGVSENQLNTPRSGLPKMKTELDGEYISKVLDGNGTTNWDTISWNENIPSNTNLAIYTRTGDTPTYSPGNWSSWSSQYQNSNGAQITSPSNRYIQYMVEFSTTNISRTAVLHNVTITGGRYELTGELITEFFQPDDLLGWESFLRTGSANSQTIESYYALIGAAPWTPVPGNGDMTGVSTTSGRIRFRFVLSTSDITISPVLDSFSLGYSCIGALDIIEVTPSNAEVVVGFQLNFTATGFDIHGGEMLLNPSWSTTVGTILDGNFTAQTIPGVGYVNATDSGIVGSSQVTVIPGALDHIEITPNEVVVIAGETLVFKALGFDIYNNELIIDPVWSTDLGVMDGNILHAQNFAGIGSVAATVGGTIGTANVTVKLNASTHQPPKILSRVPNQVKPEDSVPWNLDLTKYESDDQDTGDQLLWYITNVNTELYGVTGAYSTNDVLTIIPVKDAYGSDNATLWLIDSDNMTASQELWVNLTPVNDKPVIENLPNIGVRYNDPYTFDYSNYVSDIESHDSELKLSIKEPEAQVYTSVSGLNVTYDYPVSMMGEIQLVTIQVSDSLATVERTIAVTISDNFAPRLIKAFFELTMYEGDTRYDVLNLENFFSDPDGDDLNFISESDYIRVQINPNSSVTLIAPSSWSGVEIITFRATDPKDAFIEGYLKVTVIGVNDPPKISPIPDIFVHYDYDYEINLSKYVSDPDNETHELTIRTSDVGNISFTGNNKMLMILNYPEILLGQTLIVKLIVTDGIEVVESEFNVHVTDNFPPVIKKPLKDVSFNEDTSLINAFALTDFFSDMDMEKLDFSFEISDSENITITIHGNSSVDFTSADNWYGSSNVLFRVHDQSKAFAETNIQVVVIPVNDAPVVKQLPGQVGKTNERWIFDLRPYLSDIDNDVDDLEILVPDLYSQIINITGFQITFQSDKPINLNLEIIVTDGNLNTSSILHIKISKQKVKTEFFSTGIWVLLTIIVLIIVGFLAITIRRRYGNFKITDAFIIHQDGVLIKYKGSTLNKNLDEDLFSGMLTGIQTLISDSFSETVKEKKSHQMLSQLKMGDYEVIFHKGQHITVVLIYTGSPGRRLTKLVSHFVTTMEKKHGSALADWDGTYKSLSGIEKVIEPYLKK